MHDAAILRAKALQSRAFQNGKPLRVFLGFRRVGGQYRPVAVDDATNLVKSLPRDEITVAGGDAVEVVAIVIHDAWARLTSALHRVPEPSAVPAGGHDWRRNNDFTTRKSRA